MKTFPSVNNVDSKLSDDELYSFATRISLLMQKSPENGKAGVDLFTPREKLMEALQDYPTLKSAYESKFSEYSAAKVALKNLEYVSDAAKQDLLDRREQMLVIIKIILATATNVDDDKLTASRLAVIDTWTSWEVKVVYNPPAPVENVTHKSSGYVTFVNWQIPKETSSKFGKSGNAEWYEIHVDNKLADKQLWTNGSFNKHTLGLTPGTHVVAVYACNPAGKSTAVQFDLTTT